MSKQIQKHPSKMTVKELRAMYHRGEKITAITAYDYTMARIIDQTEMDIILVGDSLGMVVQGQSNTLPVNMEEMEYHTKCVAAGVSRAHLVADMPFMSYQASHEDAVKNAGRLLKIGAESIKLEGGEEIADLVWYLNKVGIPVMGHIGLKPQSINTMGGYKIQGKSKNDADVIFNDAQALEEAGAYAIVLEGLPIEVAQEITECLKIPTIGIGSGVHCGGQILVCYDLLGANPDFKPRFVRQYMNLHETVIHSVNSYIKDIRDENFPAESESVHRTLVEVKQVQGK